jgi:hypothetical protein
MSTTTTDKTAKSESADMLRKFAPEGSTIYCVLRSVSKSGMSRRIDFYVIARAQEREWMQCLSGWISHLGLGAWNPDKSGLMIRGCGMDMGFHVVYELSYALYGKTDALRSVWI